MKLYTMGQIEEALNSVPDIRGAAYAELCEKLEKIKPRMVVRDCRGCMGAAFGDCDDCEDIVETENAEHGEKQSTDETLREICRDFIGIVEETRKDKERVDDR